MMEIKAQLSALDFYNQRSGLQDGAYEVVEHDGEINIAVVRGLKETRWSDQGDWIEAQEELKRELLFEGNMRTMDEWDSLLDEPNDGLDNIPPSYHNDCGGCGTCHQCDNSSSVTGGQRDGMGGDCSASTLDGMMFKNKDPKPEQSLADILRASLVAQDELQS